MMDLKVAAQQALSIFDWLERRSIYQDSGMQKAHADLRAAIASSAASQSEPRLTEEARVAHCNFGIGAPERLVVEAAKRAAQRPQGGINEEVGRELRQMIADNAGRAAFLESHPAVSKELCDLIEENERLRDALAAPAPAAPVGWVLVPVEPTEAMEQAAADYLDACVKAWGLWEAMLAAAPKTTG